MRTPGTCSPANPTVFRRRAGKLQFSTPTFENDAVRSLKFPDFANLGFLFIKCLKIIFPIYFYYKNSFLNSENSKNYYFNFENYF